MKNRGILFLLLSSFVVVNAQEKKSIDTVKTEIVTIITTYNPKIADASKIKRTPELTLSEKSKKRKLQYPIYSVPVASTFMPKTGTPKSVDLGKRDRIYKNYIAAGYGNYSTPFLEAALRSNNSRNKSEMGLTAKYISSNQDIQNTSLTSSYSNFNTSLFYKQQERDFDWKITLNSAQDKYNWYGIPEFLKQTAILSEIVPQQKYNFTQLIGDLNFKNSFIENGTANLSYFSDAYKSVEILGLVQTKFNFPLDFIDRQLNALSVNTQFEIFKGNFKKDYVGDSEVNYSIITTKIQPSYRFSYEDISFKTGFKVAASFDTENNVTNQLLYPDVEISAPIIVNFLTIYAGVTGDLNTNTYRGFTAENPYVSPTLFMTQTSEKQHFFLGSNTSLNTEFSFHFKASYKNEEDKPLFVRNNSKSNGNTLLTNGKALEGYEYGNSFHVVYDDVTTTRLLAEVEYQATPKITTSATVQYDSYQLTNENEAWNLPQLQASILGTYQSGNWYASSTLYFMGERKDGTYSGTFLSNRDGIHSIDSFIDINVNGGYRFNDHFSVFLKLNNILNSSYQQFSNFDVQGFQALGGLTYQFDF